MYCSDCRRDGTDDDVEAVTGAVDGDAYNPPEGGTKDGKAYVKFVEDVVDVAAGVAAAAGGRIELDGIVCDMPACGDSILILRCCCFFCADGDWTAVEAAGGA